MATREQKLIVSQELRRLETARGIMNEVSDAMELMGMEKGSSRLNRAIIIMATAEGEIEQALFKVRGGSSGYKRNDP
jgi:hypothetical protein